MVDIANSGSEHGGQLFQLRGRVVTYRRSGTDTYPAVRSARTGTGTNETAKMEKRPTVIVVDDDRQARESIGSLLRSAGFESKILASAREFLA
jgi:PleD family two-component response regulator